MPRSHIPCPNCGKPASAAKSNPHRPFCSKRCKLIDLGEWIHEEHHIAGETSGDSQGMPWHSEPHSRH